MASIKLAIKPVLALIFIILIGSFMYWVWQRQPQGRSTQDSPQEKQIAPIQKQDKTDLELNPNDGSVMSNSTVTFTGKTQANYYIVISSNSTLGITQANDNGEFAMDSELIDGLSLISVTTLDTNLVQQQLKALTLYVSPDASFGKVFAGSVKSIFDKIITVTTLQGEQTIRQKSSTEITLPESEDDEEDNAIRVGDYLIALGKVENEKDFSATSIEIIRQDKPQNLEKYVAGTLLSSVNKDLFSIRNQQDSSIVEFTLNDETIISRNGDKAQIEDILKDKRAIIIYFTQNGENIPDLVYLLP